MPKRTRTKGTKGTKRKGQFLWNMKGCSRKKCMSGGATLAYDPNRPSQLGIQNPIDYPKAYTGSQLGGCGTCYGGGSVMRGGRRRRTQRGGGGGVPSPLVGNAWSSNPASWPQGNGSEIPLNTSYKNQPGYPGVSERVGGARRRTRRHTRRQSRKRKQRGGGVGLGGIFGGIGSDLSNAYHTLKGIPPNPSPNPWQGQYSGQDNLGYVNFAGVNRAPPVNTR